jgi:outer membrane protein OmpA-like peptidoglycan-associated protein
MHYILALILLTVSLCAKSTDFSIIIDEPFNNALLDVTQDYDRSISAVGFVKTYKNSSAHKGTTYTNAFDYLESLSNSHGSQIHLVKVDNKANILLRKSTNLSNFNEAVAVVKTPENGYFIGGYTLDGSLLILKLDSNGNIIFNNTFGTSNYDKMSNLILLRDGGVLAIGSSATTRSQHDNLFETGLGLNDIYISRFSKDGTKLWSKKYGTQYDDKGIDAVEANDGSIVVLSQTNYDKFRNISIMRITENGNKIWLKHYKNEIITTPYKLIQLRDNNFVASLTQENDMHKEQIRLIKFDLQKNILLDKVIGTTYASVLKDIKEYSDSKLIGVGHVKDRYNTDALAMLLDSEFTMLSQEHYGDDEYDAFEGVTILHNSQAAAVGLHTNKESQESNMWIVKLNRDISMAQISKKSLNFYAELSAIFKQEIQANKIVIKEDLSINFIDESLYFKVSEYELTDEQKKFLQKFSIKLLSFLHKHVEYINTLEINGHTSSEWGVSDFTGRYIKNAKLSMNRSYSTLSYIFKNQDNKTKLWLSDVIKGSGLSFSKKVMLNEQEDKEKSRRVSFKIILEDK